MTRASLLRRCVLATAALLLACAELSRAAVVFIPEGGSSLVRRVSSNGVSSIAYQGGFIHPQAIVFDAEGNAFVADSGAEKVFRFPVDGGTAVAVGGTVPGAYGLAFDAEGVLYVASSTGNRILKLSGGTFVNFATLPAGSAPRAIVFSASGELFVANSSGNTISKVTAAGAVSQFSNDVTAPSGLAFDSTGKLHVLDSRQGGRLAEFNPQGKSRALVSSLGTVSGLGFDRAGSAFFGSAPGTLRRYTKGVVSDVATGLGFPGLLNVLAPTPQVVAFSGQSVIAPEGGRFATLGTPSIGGNHSAFKATLLTGIGDITAANAQSLWRTAGGEPSLVVRQGAPAPGTSGAIFRSFADPIMNENGRIAFAGLLHAGVGDATAANASGVWSDASGAIQLIARKGAAAPGLAEGVKFTAFKQIMLPDAGGVAVLASVAGPGISAANNLGLWSADEAGTLTLLARKGDLINAGGSDRRLTGLTVFATTPFASGQQRNSQGAQVFTFLAVFSDATQAIVSVAPGVAPVVESHTGKILEQAIPQGKIARLNSPAASSAGSFAYLATLAAGPGFVSSTNNAAILRQSESGLERIARKAFVAPGTNNAVFATLANPVSSKSGEVAFRGTLKVGLADVTASDAIGLWSDASGELQLIARQGSPAPDLEADAKFAKFNQLVLPVTGGPLFVATVSGAEITSANNLGLWAADASGGVELLLRKGDQLEIDGQARTVASFSVFTAALGITGQSRHFNDRGDAACLVECTDGTQAIMRFRRP